MLDRISEFLSQRKGLLPLAGLILVTINLLLRFIPGLEWLVRYDILLHLGVVLAILGFLLARAL